MKWFLVLLFWNPEVQDFQVRDGWSPWPYDTYQVCARRMEYAQNYLPSYQEGSNHLVDCVQAEDQQTAIEIAKE